MSMGKKQTIGYKYYLGMHLVLCHGPIDAITRIEVGDKEVWTGSNTGGSLSISKGDIFGGDESEGGISGTLDVDMGSSTQGVNSYLASKLGEYTPAFRGVVSLILRQMYLGNSQYIKQWKVRGKRTKKRTDGSAMWYSSKAEISGSSMNPAHIIHECLTDKEWGLGYPAADIDLVALTAAADTLYAEGMGISLLWDSSSAIEDFIKTILEHIDGSLYVDRATGRFKLKLSRNDYNASTLLVLDEDSIRELTSLKRSSQAELYNSVTVKYWDIRTGDTNTVTVQDIALAAQQGRTVGTTVDYPGFTSAELANKVAMRDLKALSTPLLSCTLIANRVAANLNPGDVFKLSWPRNGIDNVVMRVVSVDIGTTSDTQVRIECVEDVFALGTAVYSTPPTTGWEHPSSAPAASPFRSVVEAPYREVASVLTDPVASALPAETGYVLATGSRPAGDALNSVMMTDSGAGYAEAAVADFCPTAILSAAVDRITTTWSIESGVDLEDVSVGTYAMIGNEAVAIASVSDTTVTVRRGVLDTVPEAHDIGAVIMFVEDYYAFDSEQYGDGEAVGIKLLTVTAQGTLSEASAPVDTVTLSSRASRPYPPANVTINDNYHPDVVSEGCAVAWATRNRLQQSGGEHVSWYSGSVTPEDGATTTVTVRNSADLVVFEESGISDTSKIVPLATDGLYTLSLKTLRGALESLFDYSHQFNYYLIEPGDYTPELLGVTYYADTTSTTTHDVPIPVSNISDLIVIMGSFSAAINPTVPSGWTASYGTAGSAVTSHYTYKTMDLTEGSSVSIGTSAACYGSFAIYRFRAGTYRASYAGRAKITAMAKPYSTAASSLSVNAINRPWESRNEFFITFASIINPSATPIVNYSWPDGNNTQAAGTVARATMHKSSDVSTKPTSSGIFTLDGNEVAYLFNLSIRGNFTPTAPELRLQATYNNGATSFSTRTITNFAADAGPGALAIVVLISGNMSSIPSTPSGWTSLYGDNGMRIAKKVVAASDIGTDITLSWTSTGKNLGALYFVEAGSHDSSAASVYGATSGASATGSVVVPETTAPSATYGSNKNTVLTFMWHSTSPYDAVSSFPDVEYTSSTFNQSPGGLALYSSNSYVTGNVIPPKTFALNANLGGWRAFNLIVKGLN